MAWRVIPDKKVEEFCRDLSTGNIVCQDMAPDASKLIRLLWEKCEALSDQTKHEHFTLQWNQQERINKAQAEIELFIKDILP